jgi:hypothetical protein
MRWASMLVLAALAIIGCKPFAGNSSLKGTGGADESPNGAAPSGTTPAPASTSGNSDAELTGPQFKEVPPFEIQERTPFSPDAPIIDGRTYSFLVPETAPLIALKTNFPVQLNAAYAGGSVVNAAGGSFRDVDPSLRTVCWLRALDSHEGPLELSAPLFIVEATADAPRQDGLIWRQVVKLQLDTATKRKDANRKSYGTEISVYIAPTSPRPASPLSIICEGRGATSDDALVTWNDVNAAFNSVEKGSSLSMIPYRVLGHKVRYVNDNPKGDIMVAWGHAEYLQPVPPRPTRR